MLTLGLFAVPVDVHAENNVVRVLLTKLNLTDQVTLSLDGSYTLGDLSFQRGSRLKVACVDGELMVYYEGMALSGGKEVRLIRHAVKDGKENGLRVNGAFPLYCGDLSITIQENMLVAVLHIPVEEYLMGVVPYEMGDGFPLEALKAQAIAARTYALRRVGSVGSYDLVDNTNDQVYRGYQRENKRSIQAVQDTVGICGFYKNQLVTCYYTASNGGQTELPEHVWGKTDGPYISLHADPYDVENPESPVKKAVIAKAPTDGILGNQAFTDAVLLMMTEQLEAEGFTGETEDVTIKAVEGMELHSPKDHKDSLVMTRLNLSLLVSLRQRVERIPEEEEEMSIFQVPGISASPVGSVTPAPTATPVVEIQTVEKQIHVEAPVFTCLEPLLALSINGSSNEILTIQEEEDDFVIESRRYGHGVGMSQRGAQWMAAQYDWTYDQILRFYYPGLTFKRIDTSVSLPPALSAVYLTTPGPEATPTPRPTLMPVTDILEKDQWRARVTQIGVNSSLNLRSAPSTEADILRLLYYGQELIVLEQLDEDWLRVKTDVIEGYVMERFVEKIK